MAGEGRGSESCGRRREGLEAQRGLQHLVKHGLRVRGTALFRLLREFRTALQKPGVEQQWERS